MIDRKLPGLQFAILAAGFSTRLGQPKALAKIRGVSLIRRTVGVLSHFTTEKIIIVTGPRATRLRVELRGYRVTCLANSKRARGLSTSVRRALRHSRYSAATLLLPVDLSDLAAKDIFRLISRWRGARRRVTARRLGEQASTPLILPKWLYPAAVYLAADMGLRPLLAQLSTGQRTLLKLPSAARDIDTPQDLAYARRRARRQCAF